MRALFFTTVLLLFLMASEACCEQKAGEEDAFNLGVLDAEGLPVSQEELKDQKALPKKTIGIRLTSVFPAGAAEKAGLCPGDIIVGAGKSFLVKEGDPVYRLMEHLEAATSTQGAKLELIILRGGKPVPVEVQLEYLGRHAADCPVCCERCDGLIAKSLEALAGQQTSNGSFKTPYKLEGKVVVTAVCGLAFLASGSTMNEGPYAKQVSEALDYVIENCGKWQSLPGKEDENWNQVNWALGYSGLFLCEAYDKTPTERLKNKIEEVRDAIVRNQEPSGGWGHGPGGLNSLGYLELEIVSNWCLAALGMMKQLDFKVPDSTIQKGIAFISECGGGAGGIGYSTRPGQKGLGDPGRTAGAIFAFAMLGQKTHPFYRRMAAYLDLNMKGIPDGHISPVMHFMQAALACRQLEPACGRKFMGLFRLESFAARRADGLFSARPSKKSESSRDNMDRTVGTAWIAGNYLVALQLPKGRLALATGGKRR